MKLCDVYQAATKRVMLSHHNAGSDVTTAITVAMDPCVWTRRNLRLSCLNGLYLLSDKEEVIQQNLQTAMESVCTQPYLKAGSNPSARRLQNGRSSARILVQKHGAVLTKRAWPNIRICIAAVTLCAK